MLIGHQTLDVVVTVRVVVEGGSVTTLVDTSTTVEILTEGAGHVDGGVGVPLWHDAVGGMVTKAVSVTVEGAWHVPLPVMVDGEVVDREVDGGMVDDGVAVVDRVVGGLRVVDDDKLDLVDGSETAVKVRVGGLNVELLP